MLFLKKQPSFPRPLSLKQSLSFPRPHCSKCSGNTSHLCCANIQPQCLPLQYMLFPKKSGLIFESAIAENSTSRPWCCRGQKQHHQMPDPLSTLYDAVIVIMFQTLQFVHSWGNTQPVFFPFSLDHTRNIHNTTPLGRDYNNILCCLLRQPLSSPSLRERQRNHTFQMFPHIVISS